VSTLDKLTSELRADGGLLAATLRDEPVGAPLQQGDRTEVQLLLEAIREGYELHYGAPRVVATDDPDLALLAGDRLYALGLQKLAELGDLGAVTTLSDLISASARAHAEEDPARAEKAWTDAVSELHRAGSPEPGATAP
jgi:hypothetical protein